MPGGQMGVWLEECGTDRDHRVDQKYTVQLYVA